MEGFGVIYADPPWAYGNAGAHPSLRGYANHEYDLLSTKDLCGLDVSALAHDGAVLVLWTTFPMIQDAMAVIDAWDFHYVTGLPWIKTTAAADGLKYGVGYWLRGVAELVLIGKRKKAYRTNFAGLLTDEHTALIHPALRHSRKPDTVYDLCEAFDGPYLELFARRKRDGWIGCGDEYPDFPGEDIRASVDRLKSYQLQEQDS